MYLCVLQCTSATVYFFFFFNDTATTEIYTLSLHDALPIARNAPPVCSPRKHRLGDRWQANPSAPDGRDQSRCVADVHCFSACSHRSSPTGSLARPPTAPRALPLPHSLHVHAPSKGPRRSGLPDGIRPWPAAGPLYPQGSDRGLLAPDRRPRQRRGLQRHPNHRSEEHTSELQSHSDLVCRLLLEKKNYEIGKERQVRETADATTQ